MTAYQIGAHEGTEFSLNDPTHTFVVRVLGKSTLAGDILRVEADAAQTGRCLVVEDKNGNEVLAINGDGTIEIDQSTLTITGTNIVTDTTGIKIATAVTQKLGFWNATPVIQQARAAQAAVVGTSATNSTPYGYSQAQADAIVTLINEIRTTLVNVGIMKGSA